MKSPQAASDGNAEQRMYLVQLLLPLYDNDGHPFPAAAYAELRAELTERFGGLS